MKNILLATTAFTLMAFAAHAESRAFGGNWASPTPVCTVSPIGINFQNGVRVKLTAEFGHTDYVGKTAVNFPQCEETMGFRADIEDGIPDPEFDANGNRNPRW